MIVLGIVSMILLFTVRLAGNGICQWQHNRFWRELRQEWQFSQSTALVNHQPTTINYDPVNREFVFISNNHERTIQVPEELRVQSAPARTMKANGYIQPGTWQFVDQLDQQQILMRIQMAGGGYRLEKKRLFAR